MLVGHLFNDGGLVMLQVLLQGDLWFCNYRIRRMDSRSMLNLGICHADGSLIFV